MNFEFLTDKEIIEGSKAKTYTENLIMRNLFKAFGEVATVQEVAKYFKISKSNVYRCIEARKIISVRVGNKLLIITKTLINLIGEENK